MRKLLSCVGVLLSCILSWEAQAQQYVDLADGTDSTTLYDNEDGEIGIGTESPAYPLHVRNSANWKGILLDRDSSSTCTDFTFATNGTRDNDMLHVFEESSGAQHRLTIKNGGNVGIGNTNPSYLLDVGGTGYFLSTLTLDGDLEAADGNGLRIEDDGGNLGIFVSDGGNVGIGDPTPGCKLDVSGAGYFSGNLTVDGDLEAADGSGLRIEDDGGNLGIFIRDGGNVGIGVSSPTAELHVGDDARVGDWLSVIGHITVGDYSEFLVDDTGTYAYVGLNDTTPDVQFDMVGKAYRYWNSDYRPNFNIPSDQRLKTNIRPLVGALDRITQLNAYEYEYINTEEFGEGTRVGFIAQEIEQAFPEWIEETDVPEELASLFEDGEKMKTIGFTSSYYALVAQALKELRLEKEQLEQHVSFLEAQLWELKTVVCSDHPEVSTCNL